MKTVRNYYNKEIQFQGTLEECERWILDRAEKWESVICRIWTEDNGVCYDVGELYIITD